MPSEVSEVSELVCSASPGFIGLLFPLRRRKPPFMHLRLQRFVTCVLIHQLEHTNVSSSREEQCREVERNSDY